jgi:hypothetical protein
MPTSVTKLVCVKCQNTRAVGICSNCGGELYKYWSIGNFGNGSLECTKCSRSWAIWTCERCGCENTIDKSMKECFIATAVYEGRITPEVTLLRSYRDNVLNKNQIGKLMVRMYEKTSPLIAEMAYSHKMMRSLLRKFLVNPAVAIVRYIYNDKSSQG